MKYFQIVVRVAAIAMIAFTATLICSSTPKSTSSTQEVQGPTIVIDSRITYKSIYESVRPERDEEEEIVVIDTEVELPDQEKTLGEDTEDSIEVEEVVEFNPNLYSIHPDASSFKCYMDYLAITSTTSTQYKMQQIAYTDENGLRKIDEYYCVAMGTYYGKCGDKFYVETDEGNSWKVIISDVKSDLHTNETKQFSRSNGCMMEFLVDLSVLPNEVAIKGTVNDLGFSGYITYLEKLS